MSKRPSSGCCADSKSASPFTFVGDENLLFFFANASSYSGIGSNDLTLRFLRDLCGSLIRRHHQWRENDDILRGSLFESG
jgi:hypothetical protein